MRLRARLAGVFRLLGVAAVAAGSREPGIPGRPPWEGSEGLVLRLYSRRKSDRPARNGHLCE